MKLFRIKAATVLILILTAIMLIGNACNAQSYTDSNGHQIPIYPKQKEEIKLDVKILSNDIYVECHNVSVLITNLTKNSTKMVVINSDFTMWLLPDNEYCISFSRPEYNLRTIFINTTAPNTNRWYIELTMRLYTNQSNDTVGLLYYDKTIDNFTSTTTK